MKFSEKQYDELIKQVSPNTKVSKTLPKAFLIGGLICSFGEICRKLFISLGASSFSASNWVSILLIFITALLTGVGLFNKIAKFSGAGTFVPITGFANAMVAPALEFRTEGLVGGLAAKMFIIAGPVIVYGIFSSWVFGVIYYIIRLFGGII